jgi:hypothetical protein
LNDDLDASRHRLPCLRNRSSLGVAFAQIHNRETFARETVDVGSFVLKTALLDHNQVGRLNGRDLALAASYFEIQGRNVLAYQVVAEVRSRKPNRLTEVFHFC